MINRIILFVCLAIITLSGVGWHQYFSEVEYVQDYHSGYRAFVWIPAILLCAFLLMALAKTKWIKITGLALSIPTMFFWIFSLLVVYGDFRIH